jgi:hypothetical protein
MSSFWFDPQLTPKRQHRWLMTINGIPQWLVKKVNKPSFEISEVKHNYLNHTFYYPGRVEYQKSEITLVDPVSPDAAGLMMQLLAESGYSLPTSMNVTNTITKARAVGAMGDVRITQIDGNGKMIDQFTFINAWLSSAKFGDLDYSSDELVDVTLSIRYDFVTMPAKGDIEGILTADAQQPQLGPGSAANGGVFEDL